MSTLLAIYVEGVLTQYFPDSDTVNAQYDPIFSRMSVVTDGAYMRMGAIL